MRKVLTLLFAALLLAGCAAKQEAEIDSEDVRVYVTKVEDVFFKEKKSRDVLKHFPFVTMRKNVSPKGKFSDEFYQSINYIYTAKNIKDVDYWELEKEPKSVDFIYVLPLWMKEYRKLSDDLLTNISYSYNLSEEEQAILREWIEQGGVLWVESGVFSTKYDMFTRGGEIAVRKIKERVVNDLAGLHFLQKPLKTYLMQSQNLDAINYVEAQKDFKVRAKQKFFHDIRRLRLNLDNYLQNYFVILDKTLIESESGEPLVTYTKVGKGYVVSLLPFEYEDVYYDGELLRWKLFYFVYKNRGK
jgi:hypothetical protein